MSYILDALRRAEVERERGKVPGLHDQSLAGGSGTTPGDERPGRGAWIGGGAVVLVAALVLVWALKDHGDGAPVASNAVSTVAAPAATTAPATIAPEPAPAAPTQAVRPNSPVVSQLAIPGQPNAAPRELAPVPAQVAPTTPSPATAAATVTTANTATASRLYESSELPDDVRGALPPLTIGGAMYSATPSARLLIVNGQVVHEGEPVAKGVMLEQIRLKSAVLAFRGYRYLINF